MNHVRNRFSGRLAILSALTALTCLFAASAAAAAEAPKWKLTVHPSADYFLPASGENDVYTIEAEDVGGPTTTSEAFTIEDTLPGLLPFGSGANKEEAVGFFSSPTGLGGAPGRGSEPVGEENLAGRGLCPTLLRCEYPGPLAGSLPAIKRGQKLVMQVRVAVPATGYPLGALEDRARISGGAAATVEASATNEVSPEAPYRITDFSSSLTDEGGGPYTEAGAHPYQFTTYFNFATTAERQRFTQDHKTWVTLGVSPDRDPQSILSELPPGLIANPQAVPHCPLADYFASTCPISTVVGTAAIGQERSEAGPFSNATALINLQPEGNFPGLLGFNFQGFAFLVTAGLRSGSDYGVTAGSAGIIAADITGAEITLWGIPADPSHDRLRGKECTSLGTFEEAFESEPQQWKKCESSTEGLGLFPKGGPAEYLPTPFVTLPTKCSGEPLITGGRSAPWQVPSEEATATATAPAVGACNQLKFEPEIEARPTTTLADAPSGLEFHLHLPEECWQEKETVDQVEGSLCQSDLHEALVKLPAGLTVNPSSGNGLGACSPAQIGLKTDVGQTPAHFTEVPAACPEQSAIGTAEVDTPLLHTPLKGVVFLATPRQNPFESLLAAYIVLEGEGLIIKLPGQIEADPQTGQLTGKFLENPQTPFEDFHLSFFGGAKGDLRTPAVCGSYETTAALTPYSHLEGEEEATPIAEPTSEFETTEGPQGGACPNVPSEEPNAPVFRAGTESPQAGAFTPFGLRLAREDGSQEIERIETTLPSGLTAKLAGVAECSEAQLAVAQSREHEGGGAEEQANPACPASSEVGTVQVASGAGPTPLNVSGHAYLAGPYKGAPLSLAIITPAVAGPFDLGDVLVRTALYTAPYNAQIRAVSDPIPHILQGIPLDVRSITLKMNRPNFTLNPTDCEEMGFAGSETSLLGNLAPLSQRFQVGGCGALPFKPKLAISLKGGTRRSTFPALTATVTMPPGQANIGKAQVTLPHNEQLEQAHITSQVCLQSQLATQTCPPASVYGYAKAQTPLLDHPLEGPVYLGVGFGHKLPDLVAELNGQIRVLLHGKVDTGREDGLRNTFEVVPDAPVSKFTLHMFGGKKGLIVNSENLCGKHAKRKALARFTAQSGKVVELEPTVKNSCKKKGKRGKGHGKGKHGGKGA